MLFHLLDTILYPLGNVSTELYPICMDFKEASSRLIDGHTLADVASETGMSEATVRRARLEPGSPAYRSPPPNWKKAIIELAEERIESLSALIRALRG